MSATFKRYGACLAALLSACSLVGATPLAAKRPVNLNAFVGRWLINKDMSKMGRMGPTGNNILRSTTFTWVFTPKAPGLQMDVYATYPQSKPTRSMTMIPDETPRGCDSANQSACLTTGGNTARQRYAYYDIDDRMVARVFWEGDKVVEYGTYAVSVDGKTMTVNSWNPETPYYQNLQVFDKQPNAKN